MPRSVPKSGLMHCRWLFVGALLLTSAASAEPALVLAPPTLQPSSTRARRVRLSCERQRCLVLRVSPRWLAAARVASARTVVPAAVAGFASAQFGRAATAVTAPAAAPPSVGAHVALRDGRELDLQLTPTPTRCAPLLSLRY